MGVELSLLNWNKTALLLQSGGQALLHSHDPSTLNINVQNTGLEAAKTSQGDLHWSTGGGEGSERGLERWKIVVVHPERRDQCDVWRGCGHGRAEFCGHLIDDALHL